MTVELFGTGDRERMEEAIAIRMDVFVQEQRVPVQEEIDEHDRGDGDAVHALVRDSRGRALATGRFYRRDASTAQIGRMAVRKTERGQGAGRMLLRALMDEARSRGYHRAVLAAQLHAKPFYAKEGFIADGPVFDDAGIPHQEMHCNL